MAAITLNSLPDEVLQSILLGSAKKRKDLTSVRLVSGRFHNIVNPEYWRTIVLQPAYSQEFSTWLQRQFCDRWVHSYRILVLLIAHLPQLEHISCFMSDRHDQRLLLDLFDQCRPARLLQLGIARPAGSSDRTPLMRLSKVSLRNSSSLAGLVQQTPVMQFPLVDLQVSSCPTGLFRLAKIQPRLESLELKDIAFMENTVRLVLVAFPCLKHLTYGALRSYESNTDVEIVNVDPAGQAIRELGKNLTHINFHVYCDGEAGDFALVGSLGPLCSLTGLKTLVTMPGALLRENSYRTLGDMLPTSIEMLTLATSDDGLSGCGQTDVEAGLPNLLTQSRRFPHLAGVRLGWIPTSDWQGHHWDVEGWDRGIATGDSWVWLARTAARKRIVRQLAARDMQLCFDDPSAAWDDGEHEDQVVFKSLSQVS
ncbi:uncharacterized protein B0I36DRAFT_355715 [Microdochium trichocladiopsis]|uniref:F-box domain-containing protein n=1 Tax=Microdochium trichocladiopsis TaxID=1682393 RepID=A0A9P8XSP9_9PEZI|nr:uncharacterized protein B0I36DRAFT_355715 [Microdochium trichocladiopsis]KAH7014515.1 hypothetical protein B0I36DRAFT_355715 [Microdochium trichocladiopsis]